VTGSAGVDAWKGVEYRLGGTRFRGTAYFRDVADLKLGGKIFCLNPKYDRTPTGQLAVTIALPNDKGEIEFEEERASRESLDVSEEEFRHEVRRPRDLYEDGRTHVVAAYAAMNIRSVFQLPGEPREVSGFLRRQDGWLEVSVYGQASVAALDGIVASDELLREHLLLERSRADDRQARVFLSGDVLERLRACRAVLEGPRQPLFDYETEVEEARSGMKELVQELTYGKGIVGPTPGPGIVVWRDGEGPPQSGVTYPWRSIVPGFSPYAVPSKILVPIPFVALYMFGGFHGYLKYPYAEEAGGSAFIVPHTEGPELPPWLYWCFHECPYVVLPDGSPRVHDGTFSVRVWASGLSGGVEGWRTEARVDFPGYFGFFGGVLDLGGSTRSYFRFTNAFIMNTRAVASLDLGSVHARGEDRFEWGMNADVFPRKPWLVHFAYHEFGGPDESEFGLSLGVAVKALEITAGWTCVRDAGRDRDALEAGARVWWAF
jgi:hypothetical protein